MGIADIIHRRDALRQAEAAALARAALAALRNAGLEAWLIGSLARGEFRQHSDIDVLIDAPRERQSAALRLCLGAGNRMLDILRQLPGQDDEQRAWVIHAAISSGVSGLYTGIKETLRELLSVVDEFVPTGEIASRLARLDIHGGRRSAPGCDRA